MDFINLKAQQKIIRKDIEAAILRVLDHGQYIMGPEVALLEEELAKFVGVKHAIGVSSGTDALLISMMAAGIKAGDEVITTPFSFFATSETISLLGATPVYADINPKTFNIDPEFIEASISQKTKAIIPVSLYGQCADFDTINAIAKEHSLVVIEDGCQSFGATYKGNHSCSLSDIGCTSFFPSKPLGCYGDGGACFTNDDDLAKAMREIRTHGQSRRYFHSRIGINGRIDTIQAAILLAKLKLFPEEINARQQIAKRYDEMLNSLNITTPYIEPYNQSVYAQYTISADHRDRISQHLNSNGIPTAIHYPLPLSRQPALLSNSTYELSENASKTVLSLPMHPYLTKQEQEQVVAAIDQAITS